MSLIQVSTDHLQYLRRLYADDSAHFKSIEQSSAVAHVLRAENDLLFVSGTGSGKSLLFLLPAFVENVIHNLGKMTIVIVPLVSLTVDLQRRATSLGIHCSTWSGASNTANYHLLFVSAEACTSPSFRSLTQENFRPAMSKVHTIRIVSVPLILLSATVPLDMEAVLKATYAAPFMPTIRSSSTARPNIHYAVKSLDSAIQRGMSDTEKEDLYIHFIKERIIAKGLNGSAGIIYVPFTKTAESLALKLSPFFTNPCLPYYANYAYKSATQEQFMTPTSCVVIATNAFGCGIDKLDVKFVYHMEIPGSLLDYAQESGRVARNHSVMGDCCIFTCTALCEDFMAYRISQSSPNERKFVEKQLNDISTYVKSRNCRRFILHSSLDPSPVSCNSVRDFALCDNSLSATSHTYASNFVPSASRSLPSASSSYSLPSRAPAILRNTIIASASKNLATFRNEEQVLNQLDIYTSELHDCGQYQHITKQGFCYWRECWKRSWCRRRSG